MPRIAPTVRTLAGPCAQVDAFACTHTCLPVFQAVPAPPGRSPRWILNNGAAGMPNFRGDAAGLLTRIAVEPFAGPATAFRCGDRTWRDRRGDRHRHRRPRLACSAFLRQWPAGSDAHVSYFDRIARGPAYDPADAVRRRSEAHAGHHRRHWPLRTSRPRDRRAPRRPTPLSARLRATSCAAGCTTMQLLFLARHGAGHRLLPHEVNYRANVFALKRAGATMLLGFSAVGSLALEVPPGHTGHARAVCRLDPRGRASARSSGGVWPRMSRPPGRSVRRWSAPSRLLRRASA